MIVTTRDPIDPRSHRPAAFGQADARDTPKPAPKAGIALFDTAPGYGTGLNSRFAPRGRRGHGIPRAVGHGTSSTKVTHLGKIAPRQSARPDNSNRGGSAG
ncbi:aldo-keto reductase family protein [Sphingomonas abietis]|uniref:Uncharacterized protein n=1 Tax=Sphingomonas abietis TaxID=3012344 RepID=A0ABY7NK86_9SPHN|nr:hypothetical protein [Sphingomonas abietis]WBO21955.1 hypothetical protein PBT88_17595 [Sphingomonas abietis]